MSEDNNITEEENQINEQPEQKKDEFVSKSAYQNVSADMHKYKNQLKETQATLNQIQAERDASKNEALAEQGRWEELYKKGQGELESLKAERDSDKNKFVDYHKKNSVLQKVGGFKRDDYNKFINVNNVEMNEDGSINDDSLANEVDRIKQEYPELLKSGTNTKLPNEAPTGSNLGDKSYNDMSDEAKNAYKRQLLNKPRGY